jgi:hypothetical protein
MIINPTRTIRLIQMKSISSHSSQFNHYVIHSRSIWKRNLLWIYLSLIQGLQAAPMKMLRIVFRMKINILPTLTLNISKLISKISHTNQTIHTKLENLKLDLLLNISKEKIRRLRPRHFNRKNRLDYIFKCQIHTVSKEHVFYCPFCWVSS